MISPTLNRIDNVTYQNLPKTVLQMIGRFAGTDHCFKPGDMYYTHEPLCRIKFSEIGVPFYTYCWKVKCINCYYVKRVTPCSLDLSYIKTIYIVEVNHMRIAFEHNKRLPDRKILVCRRNDFALQDVIKRTVHDTEVLSHHSIFCDDKNNVAISLHREQYVTAGLQHSWIHRLILYGLAYETEVI